MLSIELDVRLLDGHRFGHVAVAASSRLGLRQLAQVGFLKESLADEAAGRRPQTESNARALIRESGGPDQLRDGLALPHQVDEGLVVEEHLKMLFPVLLLQIGEGAETAHVL